MENVQLKARVVTFNIRGDIRESSSSLGGVVAAWTRNFDTDLRKTGRVHGATLTGRIGRQPIAGFREC
jgi:hypothetical protein